MSIAKKILLPLGVVVVVYSLTIGYGVFMSRQTNVRLNDLADTVYPASQLSRKILRLFEEEIKLYQDMVVNGDIYLSIHAREKGDEVIRELDELDKIVRDPLVKKEIAETLEDLREFSIWAPDVYEEMRKTASDYSPETIEKAAHLAETWKGIAGDLRRYSEYFSNTILSELKTTGRKLQRQGLVNVLIFVFGVGASLLVVLLVVMRFIKVPLQKTIDAFSTGAMGEFSTRLDDSASDEFGRLARYFNIFMEKLEVYNRDLRAEIDSHRISMESLRKSEEIHTKLVNTIPEVVMRTDMDGRILFVNDFTLELTGFSREELIDTNMLMFISPDDHQRARDNMLVMLDGRQAMNEYMVLKKDGAILYFEIGGDVLRNEDGAPFGRVYVCRDVTPRKLAEKERVRLQEQLVQSQKMESIGKLAGGVAHDFNNMLSVIIGNAEMALEDLAPTDPFYTVLSSILNAGERSANLTRQLLAFARKQTIDPKILDLNDIVGSMLKMLQRLIGEGIRLVWSPEKGLWPVNADPSQIDQILANLVVNARDAVDDTGRITIETANVVYDEAYCKDRVECLPGDYVLLAVSDNGTGINRDILVRIFEPFFTTKPSGEGTGLGLSTVYGIVKQNGGFVNVYSEPGKGTTFKIYLPRCLSGESFLSQEGEDRIIGGSETVLVVEDEAVVLNLTRNMLERLGYTVLAAARVEEALTLAADHKGNIDLLLTDVVMPQMNGKELARRIETLRPGVKSLYMSGYTANVIAHHGILDKGVRFIAKPFSLRDLAARLREALDEGA
ncbi:hypothetical protein JCM14469_10830 [Desulfatiferula olefinivorans]